MLIQQLKNQDALEKREAEARRCTEVFKEVSGGNQPRVGLVV